MMPEVRVSRETSHRIDTFCKMVLKWNKAINLVAAATEKDLQLRHVADSAQLIGCMPPVANHWIDIGSGGGFPGLVVAAHLKDLAPACQVTLIESDQRKAVFLREASRAMALETTVIAGRIEDVPAQNADVLSARALAPLPRLLKLAWPHLAPGATALFPKGETAESEIAEARSTGWQFDLEQHKSKTDPSGVILAMRNISLDSTS
jgi:16S rRNA (guanine527-N7)-methyltransferase